MENKPCCICNQEYFGYGVNAQPIMEGLCCEVCNLKIVTPQRLEDYANGDKEREE